MHGDLAERPARDGGKSRKCAVDEQLGPACAHEIVLHDDGAHALQQLFDVLQMVDRLCDRAKREGERGGIGRQFGDALAVESRAPRNGAAERALRADNLRDRGFGQPVLTGADDAVLREVALKHRDDARVVALLGHEQNDVVLARHLLGQQGVNGLDKVHRARNVRALFSERRDVRLVAVDEVDLDARLGDICAQHRPQRSRAVNHRPHLSSAPRFLLRPSTIFLK